MKAFPPGLYDLLLTRSAQERLEATELQSQIEGLESPETPTYLARHLVQQLRTAFTGLEREQQVRLANELLGVAREFDPEAGSDLVPDPPQVLKAIYAAPPVPTHPRTPLSVNNLLMNAAGAPKLAYELESEMANADRVRMIVSFIQWRGWLRLKPAFEDLAARHCPVRILTTTYIGATDLEALQALAALPNISIRISLDGRRRRLHAKAWLFERDSGFGSVYVGSANLSGPALEDGIEWTVKLSQVEAPAILETFRGAFDTLWQDPEFEDFDAASVPRVAEALRLARGGMRPSGPVRFFDLKPHPYQQATLDQLEAERRDRNCYRNLVVAPTGTGKTMLAAFDYARQPYSGRHPRLLVLAHREELLEQAQSAFRYVLRDESFGEILAASQPTSLDYLFATVQSFNSRGLLARCGPDYWHFAVLDEAHHVPAESYRNLIAALRPKILLGLTATPERADGENILPWFDGRIADEMRLWHAIERQYVTPFDYYGIADGTDLAEMRWRRGGYAVEDLERLYVGNGRRAGLVLKRFADAYGAVGQARALGFCVSVAHAEFMAEVFRQGGVAAAAVTGRSPEDERRSALPRLRNREINVLFTVDLFNEGIDIPEADCVLLLRPTESATIFLQQLGRGLRLCSGKTSCLALDFIGNQHSNFRFDVRYQALLGGTRRSLVQALETDTFPLPGNCYIRFDQESRRTVLANLRLRLQATRVRMVRELRSLAEEVGTAPSLSRYLSETERELEDVYKGGYGWSQLLFEAGLLAAAPGPDEAQTSRRLQRMLHLDAAARIHLYRALVTGARQPQELTEAERRLVLMLSFRLGIKVPTCWDQAILALRATPALQDEFLQFCNALADRVALHVDEQPAETETPLFLHRRYTRDEVFVAMGVQSLDRQPTSREGTYAIKEVKKELFFVTLDKSEKHFSPTTRYEDYALSRTQFHWQSQSTTSAESVTGRRYCGRGEPGWQFWLFVRQRRGDAYVFLGPVTHSSSHGSRPISITWNLQVPMPAAMLEASASLQTA
ncbi:MAG TPA: DUF3427 domain-containing protein [Terriglobales bacterium]|nr:DUF3427 domain-containing protein [Terriglobales bacterium]